MQGVWVWSLVKELRSQVPHSKNKYIFISPSALQDNFVRFRNLSWCFFNSSTLSISLHSSCLHGFWREIRYNSYLCFSTGASQVAWVVKNPPANTNGGDVRDKVRFLGLEYPLEKEMATQSNILAWKIPWTEELGRLQFMGS